VCRDIFAASILKMGGDVEDQRRAILTGNLDHRILRGDRKRGPLDYPSGLVLILEVAATGGNQRQRTRQKPMARAHWSTLCKFGTELGTLREQRVTSEITSCWGPQFLVYGQVMR